MNLSSIDPSQHDVARTSLLFSFNFQLSTVNLFHTNPTTRDLCSTNP